MRVALASQERATPASSDAGALDDLGAWLAMLTSADRAARESAVALIPRADATLVTAIAARLEDLQRSADRGEMAALWIKAKPSLREQAAAGGALSHEGGAGSGLDWLDRMMLAPEPDRAAWRDVVSILGLSRMLVQIGTVPALRTLAAIELGFFDLLRTDVERQIQARGERAVPALIELRRHESKEVRGWAQKLLELLGKSLPGEAVQTTDDQVLADVLRAYGRAKETDAVSVILAFSNSERREVRVAAREAVMMLGESALRPLREWYENLAGAKPPPDWGWEKIAREVFAVSDRARFAEAYALMEGGLAAYRRGDLEEAVSAFDRVLARAPDFERRRECLPAYVDLALSLGKRDRPRAIAVLRRAKNLDPASPRARQAESLLVHLEALDLADRGIVDEAAFRRAVDLDPHNTEAARELIRLRADSEARNARFWRNVLLLATAVSALTGGIAMLLWRGRRLPR